jgi:hypothetical protein
MGEHESQASPLASKVRAHDEARAAGSPATGDELVERARRIQRAARVRRAARGESVWEPPSRNPDRTVRGWRTWKSESPRRTPEQLRSFNGDVVWPRGVLAAACLRGCRQIASSHCTCGIYAFNEAETVFQHFEDMFGTGLLVVGEVAGWGRVSLHELGWRSEFATVQALWIRQFDALSADHLSVAYDVPIRRLEDLALAQTQHRSV